MLKIIIVVLLLFGILFFSIQKAPVIIDDIKSPVAETLEKVIPSPSPKLELLQPPARKVLSSNYHTFQTFNNCGPAALSMTLSYYGIAKTQKELGDSLRPYQLASGINDDKSVTLEELAEKSKEFDLIPFHRPNGNMELIKNFITYDIPVITRTWTKINEDIGHYRVIKGYDESTKQIIQDDSLQGKNLYYTYDQFDRLWDKFSFEFLVLVPKEKKEIAETILGEELDLKRSWEHAVEFWKSKLVYDSADVYARFNLSVALYGIGDYKGSVDEFEKVEGKVPFRTLWYQIEPVLAYLKLGNYERVLSITNRILNNENSAYSEVYQIKAAVFKAQGKEVEATEELRKANLYNSSNYYLVNID